MKEPGPAWLGRLSLGDWVKTYESEESANPNQPGGIGAEEW